MTGTGASYPALLNGFAAELNDAAQATLHKILK
jgi:hypothetical protein